MAAIEISVDTSAIRQALTDLGTRTFPYIVKRALNDTGQDLLKAERESMESVFDRPTSWVLNSFYIKEAKEDNLTIELRPKEGGGKGSVPAYKTLWAEIFGGQRRHKSHELRLIGAGIMRSNEYAVPGESVPLDANGNISGQLLGQILSQMSAASYSGEGFDANITKRSRRRSITHAGGRYFWIRSEGSAEGNRQFGRNAQPGIYMRRMAGRREILPILMFVRAPHYDQRFPFRETAERVAQSSFFMHLHERFQRYKTQLGGANTSDLGG